MAMNDHKSSISNSSTRRVILIGVRLTVSGVVANVQVERHSFVDTEEFEFRFLDRTLLPELMLGLLTTSIGSILWAWRSPIRDYALHGLGIFILMPAGLALIPLNIHGWKAAFLYVGAAGMLIDGFFLVSAVVRAIVQYRAKSR